MEQSRKQDQARVDDLTNQYATATDPVNKGNLAVSLAETKQQVPDDTAKQNYIKFSINATVTNPASAGANGGATLSAGSPGMAGP